MQSTSAGRRFRCNPYVKGLDGTREDVVELYRSRIEDNPTWRAQIRRELRGKDLVCWCPLSDLCHADVLLEVANG